MTSSILNRFLARIISFIFVTLLIIFWGASKIAEYESMLQMEEREARFFQRDLSGYLQEETALQNKIREEAQIASRPYMEYLLYQKSVRFPDHSARLDEVRKERLESGKTAPPPSRGFSSYSGAPLFSFYDPNRFGAAAPPLYPLSVIYLSRIVMAIVVISIFALPLIALQKRETGPPRRRMTFLETQKWEGWKGTLHLKMKKREA